MGKKQRNKLEGVIVSSAEWWMEMAEKEDKRADEYFDRAESTDNAQEAILALNEAITIYGKAAEHYMRFSDADNFDARNKAIGAYESQAYSYEKLYEVSTETTRTQHLEQAILIYEKIRDLKLEMYKEIGPYDRFDINYTFYKNKALLYKENSNQQLLSDAVVAANQVQKDYAELLRDRNLKGEDWYTKYKKNYVEAKQFLREYKKIESTSADEIINLSESSKRKNEKSHKSRKRSKIHVESSEATISEPTLLEQEIIFTPLVKVSETLPEIPSNPNEQTLYNPFNKENVARLLKKLNTSLPKDKHVSYDASLHLKNSPKIKIGYVDAIKSYGVYADKEIKVSDTPLGLYAGVREASSDSFQENAAYIFGLTENGNMIGQINGEKIRNWTAWINHSQVPNVAAVQQVFNNELHIVFYAIKDIKPGEQLLYDYGNDYFYNLFKDENFKPYYLHADDHWMKPSERFNKQKAQYVNGLFKFDLEIKQGLALKVDQDQWLVPEIFVAIANHDVDKLKEFINLGYDLELPALAYPNIDHYADQAMVTPLMFACYMGDEQCIEALLENGADPNRCMLQTGYHALTLLLKGRASDATVKKLAPILLDHSKMDYPFVSDYNDNTILQHAVLRNDQSLVEQILKIAQEDEVDLFHEMLRDDKDKGRDQLINVFDHCIVNNFDEMIKILLKYIPEKLLQRAIEDKRLLTDSTLGKLSALKLSGIKSFTNEQLLSPATKSLINKRLEEFEASLLPPVASNPFSFHAAPKVTNEALAIEKQNNVKQLARKSSYFVRSKKC